MSSTTVTETIELTASSKTPASFVKAQTETVNNKEFVSALASAYLKATQLPQTDETASAESLKHLYEAHQQLIPDVEVYLSAEVPFVYEGQPLQPILLSFAAYRIAKASQRYLAATYQGKSGQDVDELKQTIQQYQAEYDAILQNL